jgi:lysophospholipase L1-like esterase
MRIERAHLRRALVTFVSLASLSYATMAYTLHASHAVAEQAIAAPRSAVPVPSAPAVPAPSAPAVPAPSAPAVPVLGVPAADRGPVVVALGDSVPAGSACHCRNFVSSYGDLLARWAGHPVAVTNFARGGAQTADVLRQLRQPAVRHAVHNATTVVLMVGANDFYRPFKRVRDGANKSTVYRAAARRVQQNVEQTIRQIRALHDGPVTVVVLGYWNVVKDGKVGRRDYGAAGVRAAKSATGWANGALKVAARTEHAVYVPTYRAFKGANGHRDPTRLLAPDGNHPNAAGHRLLARTLDVALPKG